MIEDKLKATDWEATDTAVAEQVSVLNLNRFNEHSCSHCTVQLSTGRSVGGRVLNIFLLRWRGKAISSGWLIRRSLGGLAVPRPQPPSQAAKCHHVALPPPPLPRVRQDTCHQGAPRHPDQGQGRRVTPPRPDAVITRQRAPASRAGTPLSRAPVEVRPPPHPPQPRPAFAPVRITASAPASTSGKQLPSLTGFLQTCSVRLHDISFSQYFMLCCFQVWKIGARTLFCTKCWPLVSRSTWRASRSATRRRPRSQGRRLRGRRIRRVESDATSDSFFKPVLNQQ